MNFFKRFFTTNQTVETPAKPAEQVVAKTQPVEPVKPLTRQDIKTELKNLVTIIKTEKPAYRSAWSAYDKSKVKKEGKYGSYLEGDSELYKKIDGRPLWNAQHEFRHKHIAYCLARGRTLEQIEPGSAGCNADMDYVNKLSKEYKKVFENEEALYSRRRESV